VKKSSIEIEPATPADAGEIKALIYQSVHELMDFMFQSRLKAEQVLEKLLQRPNGQFGYRYVAVMKDGKDTVGVVLGYSRQQFLQAELPGAVNMLRATPFSHWPFLIGTVSRALSNYVPPPADDAFYINNIAVNTEVRGRGYGTKLLAYTIDEARSQGYRSLELDVTHVNEGAIRFYLRNGFAIVSESGSAELFNRYRLPVLKRMRLLIGDKAEMSFDNNGLPTSTTVVNDVTGLYPVQVDEVYAPGTIEQLQQILRSTDKPLSIGGGRFSMGGQTACPGTLHIDMRGLNQVIDFDPENRSIRVQAGIRWKQIQDRINDYGLAIKIMQTYSNFTVGGSLSVNCHGRYVGLGPVILAVKSIDLILHDGKLVRATPKRNVRMFYAAIGGYGAIGIIVAAELELAENKRIERIHQKMPIEQYQRYFAENVRDNAAAVFHNADMIPPKFSKVRAVTWQESDKPVNRGAGGSGKKLFLLEKYMLWIITEMPGGHLRREYIYEPLLYLRNKVILRNQEADYDVAELEPLSRDRKTYVLQEYFVAPDRLLEFTAALAEILTRHGVTLVNISIRHARQDPGSLLAWARQEVFAFVLYYKQGTSSYERERVAVWTRELIDAVISQQGAYYLPYQPHARYDQFHAAYPNAKQLFKLKDKLDPDYRFRNILWQKYYRASSDPELFADPVTAASEFRRVYGKVTSRDQFYRFLQVIYHLYPEDKFHELIIQACNSYQQDPDIYRSLAKQIPGIKTPLSELTYALPALARQKSEMQRQTVEILNNAGSIDGYLELGSTGRYVKKLRQSPGITGKVYLSNETPPDNSLPEIMERGGLRQSGHFFPLNDYDPIPRSEIADASLDLVTCYIGLHHCPRDKLAAYLASIHRVLRPAGRFVLRDHDAGTDEMRVFCSLVHTVFNAGLGVSWEEDRRELRLFEGVEFWVDQVCRSGFVDLQQRLLQANDPSLNTLMCFIKQ